MKANKLQIKIFTSLIAIITFHVCATTTSAQPFPVINSNNILKGVPGRKCLSSTDCDPINTKLACVGGVCGCPSEYELFDHAREQCSLKARERCSPPKFLFGESNPCVSNAVCNEQKRVCECADYAYPDASGGCPRKKSYNATCFGENECDNLAYLSCVDGHCSCRISPYDEYHQICRRLVGDFCLRTRDCVENAECVDSRCACRESFSETSGKTCGLSYAQRCGDGGESTSCSDAYFACVNGICQCKNPSYEVYDNVTKSCLSLVGGICQFLPLNNMQPLKLKNCVQNAECVQRKLSPLSQCECATGFVETTSGQCNLPHGAVCVVPGNPEAMDCVQPLTCRNMKCECQNEDELYDPMEKTCKKTLGSFCASRNDCMQNAECVKSHCQCGVGFSPTFGRVCAPELEIVDKPPSQHLNIYAAPSNNYLSFPNYPTSSFY